MFYFSYTLSLSSSKCPYIWLRWLIKMISTMNYFRKWYFIREKKNITQTLWFFILLYIIFFVHGGPISLFNNFLWRQSAGKTSEVAGVPSDRPSNILRRRIVSIVKFYYRHNTIVFFILQPNYVSFIRDISFWGRSLVARAYSILTIKARQENKNGYIDMLIVRKIINYNV